MEKDSKGANTYSKVPLNFKWFTLQESQRPSGIAPVEKKNRELIA